MDLLRSEVLGSGGSRSDIEQDENVHRIRKEIIIMWKIRKDKAVGEV